MKSKKLKNLVKKMQNGLDWPTLEKLEEVPVVRILSDPHSRMHTIHLPLDPSAVVDEFSYLHELGHATLCEQVHPIFAANSYFATSTREEQFTALAPALQTASDWYISYWLMEICQEKCKTFLHEKLEIAEKLLDSTRVPTVDVFLDAALTIALGIKYLDAPIDCGDKLKEAVDTFLSVEPGKPTRDGLTHLVNQLMSIYTPMRARLTNDDEEYDIWEVRPDSGQYCEGIGSN